MLEAATVEAVEAVLRAHRFRYVSEEQLQESIAAVLAKTWADVRREVRLDAHNRIDVVVDRIGVEVKVAGSHYDVARQCARYLTSDLIDGLVLITSRVRHLRAGGTGFEGKPFVVITIAGAGL